MTALHAFIVGAATVIVAVWILTVVVIRTAIDTEARTR